MQKARSPSGRAFKLLLSVSTITAWFTVCFTLYSFDKAIALSMLGPMAVLFGGFLAFIFLSALAGYILLGDADEGIFESPTAILKKYRRLKKYD